MSSTQRPSYCALLGALLLVPVVSSADPWLAPGDALMRHDLQLLADVGVLRGPITSWPVPWPDIARDVLDEKKHDTVHQSARDALRRVQRAVRREMRTGEVRRSVRIAGSNEPDVLRDFDYTPREDGEITGALDWMGERVALRLQATYALDPLDDRSLRADGSYVGVSFWNFMLSAGYMERWWGPGWDGSLILSTSARPVPAITLERNYSDPFDLPVLRWLGPWRAAIFFGRLEADRADFDNAQLFGARVTFKPWRHLEIGLSRTAQWCGDGRPCGFDTFTDLFLGRDNRSDEVTIAEEPGNQLAGYDVRLSSPWASVPVAVYGQLIGEDEANGLPSKFLGLAGAEIWGTWRDGTWRATLEYSDTSCSFSHQEPEFDCAYASGIYAAGYRYRGRSIGHPTDADTRLLALAAIYAGTDGTSWQVKVRDADVNRDAVIDQPTHTIASRATDWRSIDVLHGREMFGGDMRASLGLVRRESNDGEPDNQWRLTVQWSRGF